MLVDSDLDALREVLRAPGRKRIHARGIASAPASVVKKNELMDIYFEDVVADIAKHVAPNDQVTDIDACECDGVIENRDTISSYDWVYGQTPRFSYALGVVGGRFDIEVNKGLVVSILKGSGGTATLIARH